MHFLTLKNIGRLSILGLYQDYTHTSVKLIIYTVRADIHGQNNQRHSIIKSKTIFYSGKGTLHCRRDRI